jgi:membrane protein
MSQPLPKDLARLEQWRFARLLRKPVWGAWVLAQDLVRCDLIRQASAMAYVTLLSLVPSLVAIFCVMSVFAPLLGGGVSLVDQLRDYVVDKLASGSGDQVADYLDHLLEGLDLATIGWGSFASVLLTLVLLLRQIEIALNKIWEVRRMRNAFRRFVYFWTVLTLGLLAIGVVIGTAGAFDPQRFIAATESAAAGGALGNVLASAASLTVSFAFFFALYKVVPNTFVTVRAAACGALLSALSLSLAARGYGFYIRHAASYRTLYGALAQVPLFLVWLYICWIIILVGALLSWRTQQGFPWQMAWLELETERSERDARRNRALRDALPVVALLAVHLDFATPGHGPTACHALAKRLALPPPWVGEALETLVAVGLVERGRSPDAAGDEDDQCHNYHPACPATQLSLAAVRAALREPLSAWLSTWRHALPLDLVAALDGYARATAPATRADRGRVPPETVADLLLGA